MTFTMTWAQVAEHADEWTGSDSRVAAAVLDEKIGTAISASGMNPEAQAHLRETFLLLVRDGIAGAGKAAVEAGRDWSKAAEPLLVALSPAA
ncbi:hypothetical protein GCM10018980_65810 [Streptomyces capoamus]|uniref:Uncharacterized protein n=1 Tax=Streptomyces capoamus TaxID=68183 RepID=A0A919F246_9ACTN|nr:hypothetical protein [Streptomyces capoamus]GGP31469.1 hypothetical protein GCM10010501_72620 [Streptomyces libani subsp. rufus]GHG70809.1 hypothetical protein GCM10018980_65810 [Streptomyces capoamus]